MKYVTIILSIFLSSCNSENKSITKLMTTSDSLTNNDRYPSEIIKLGLEKWYDKTKWAMYCIYCDDTCRFEKLTGIKDTVTFASLDLKFEKIEQFNDTTEINFYFYFRDTIKCDVSTIRNLGLASGAGFISGYDSIFYYTSQSTMRRFWISDSGSRYSNPLQPEVVDFIKNNKERLHPWFYNESKNRGIIK